MPQHPLQYMPREEERTGAWRAGDFAILAVAGVVLAVNGLIVLWATSDTNDRGDLFARVCVGSLANAAMIVASLVVAAVWKLASPRTRLGPFVLAAFLLPIAGYALMFLLVGRR